MNFIVSSYDDGLASKVMAKRKIYSENSLLGLIQLQLTTKLSKSERKIG
jgi:hypothetical protein